MSNPKEIVQTLLIHEPVQTITQKFINGEIQQSNLFVELQRALSDHPLIMEFPVKQHKQIFGQLTAAIRKKRPTEKKTSLGEQMMNLSPKERVAWRTESIESIVLPIAFLYRQAHLTAELGLDDPNRKDLIWHILNTAITAIRYVAILGISEYVEQGISDPHLNRALFDVLRKPSDGAWSQLIFAPSAGKEHSLLNVLAKKTVQNAGIKEIKQNMKSIRFSQSLGNHLGIPKKSPKQLNELVDTFVQFRNQMVHGIFLRTRPPTDSVDIMMRLLDLLIAALSPVLKQMVLIPTNEGMVEAMGPTMGIWSTKDFSSEMLLKYRNQPIVQDGNRIVSLSPWLTVADLQSILENLETSELNNSIQLHEICFCNRFESDLLYYLGFTAKGQIPHSDIRDRTSAEEAYKQFTKQLEAFRLRSAPPQLRTQDPIIRFDDLAEFHGENFVGRSNILKEIEKFVDSGDAPIGVITAEPGMGKSALLTHFYRKFRHVDRPHGWLFHFSARHNQRDNVFLALRSLTAQAEVQIDRIQGKKNKRKSIPWNYDDLCERLQTTLIELGILMQGRGGKAVLVLDALDEQTPRPGTPPESIFGSLPETIPPGIVILVSVRIDKHGKPVGISAGELRGPRARGINSAYPLTGLNAADVKELIYERLCLPTDSVPDLVMHHIVHGASRPSDGTLDPFYLRFLADKIRNDNLDLTNPFDIPQGLEAFFQDIWSNLDCGQDFVLHKILGMLSEMDGYGSDEMFGEVLSLPSNVVTQMRFGINKILLLTRNDNGVQYGLFHDRFRWFVQDKFTDFDKIHTFHKPLLSFCKKQLSTNAHYGLRFWSQHLQVLAQHPGNNETQQQWYQQALWDLVHNPQFIERKYNALQDENSIVGDFIRAIEVYKPLDEDSIQVQQEKIQHITTLATTSTQTITRLANLARKQLVLYAQAGDIERVIQLAKRAGAQNLEWMTILRCAQIMIETNLDPTPLYDAVDDKDHVGILWTDKDMLSLLLKQVKPPEDVAQIIKNAIPTTNSPNCIQQ